MEDARRGERRAASPGRTSKCGAWLPQEAIHTLAGTCRLVRLGLAVATFGVIFVAELPDKSLFASLVLGTRHRALWVWIGVTGAFAVHVVKAVAAGWVLDVLPRRPAAPSRAPAPLSWLNRPEDQGSWPSPARDRPSGSAATGRERRASRVLAIPAAAWRA